MQRSWAGCAGHVKNQSMFSNCGTFMVMGKLCVALSSCAKTTLHAVFTCFAKVITCLCMLTFWKRDDHHQTDAACAVLDAHVATSLSDLPERSQKLPRICFYM